MAIDKFQRSRLTFNISAKVAHVGVPSTHQNIVSSETTRPFELKFHMKTPYDRLAKIYNNCTGHMTKMATTPIYGKNPLNVFFSGTKRLTLTYFRARSNLIPNAFIWEKSCIKYQMSS